MRVQAAGGRGASPLRSASRARLLALALAVACLPLNAAVTGSNGRGGGSDFNARIVQLAARLGVPAAATSGAAGAGSSESTPPADEPKSVGAMAPARSAVLRGRTGAQLRELAAGVAHEPNGAEGPPDEEPPAAVGFKSFPPPDYHFTDYGESAAAPPPEAAEVDTKPPSRPMGPPRVYPPTLPPLPPQPLTPPPVPRPPSPPPSAPPLPLPRLRLIGGIGPNATAGVLQIWDEASQGWGALCVPRIQFAPEYDRPPDKDVAILVCRQLGLPVRGALLVSSGAFPSVPFMRMRAKAFAPTEPGYMCENAASAASLIECRGIVVAPERAGSCMQVAAQNELPHNFLPAGVDCRDGTPPPPPRAPNPPPPRPYSAPAVNYTVRIVNPRTGLTTHPNGSRVSSGRLEVLQPIPGGSQPVWGTACMNGFGMPEVVAQYACRAAGVPYRVAYFAGRRRYHLRPEVLSMPQHWVFLAGCALRPQGLACGTVAGWSEAGALLRAVAAAGLDEDMRRHLRFAVEYCDVDGQVGHQADAYVTCDNSDASPPWPPSAPAQPPPPRSPPDLVRNDVQLNATEYFDNVYGITFGVRHPVSGTTVWGTYCPSDTSLLEYPESEPVANAMCAQLTAGARPYGAQIRLDTAVSYSFVPPYSVRREIPSVLDRLDCMGVAGKTPANLSLCVTAASDPLPMPPITDCARDGWINRLISCQQTGFSNPPDLASVRLAGGANGSYGRLEVLRTARMERGWGTVCAADFGVQHAQAVCRDLRLPWTQAAVLHTSAVPRAPPSQHIAIDDVGCWKNTAPTAVPPPLSFLRDCSREWTGSELPTCGHDADVGVACGGEDTMPLPPPPPGPAYGAYGHSGPPPPSYGTYGGYGGYGGPAAPAYGT